ncbi:hypothetical protein LUZ60_013644 [Juncus effusus]|nr:hypothetical protein LUZ60_013644 [Juncus effusus]
MSRKRLETSDGDPAQNPAEIKPSSPLKPLKTKAHHFFPPLSLYLRLSLSLAYQPTNNGSSILLPPSKALIHSISLHTMRKSLRIPLSLTLLLAIFSLLSLLSSRSQTVFRPSPRIFHWAAVQTHSSTQTQLAAVSKSRPYNLTVELLRSAESDPGEEWLKKDIQDLLEGNLPPTKDPRRTHDPRRPATWRRDSMDIDHVPHRLRSPKDYRNRIRIVPELRRILRNRIRPSNRQYNITDLVKLPIGSGTKYQSCAVVGNSGILLNSNHGEEIDGHDLVIRLNNARIIGYKNDVGSKTGLSFINSHILARCAKRVGCFCHPYGETVPILMYFCQAQHFIDYLACNSSPTAPLLITDPGFDALCAKIVKFYSLKRFVEETNQEPIEWGKTHDEKLFHYSSGFQAVMAALGICEKVSLFGFGKSEKAKHHYHTNQKKELDLHDYLAEYMIYSDLAERPDVIPFLSDLGFRVPHVAIHR